MCNTSVRARLDVFGIHIDQLLFCGRHPNVVAGR